MISRPEYDLLKTGEQIRKLRRERNITAEEVREYLQIGSVQAIYKWEKGRCFPQADNLMALAKLFDVNTSDIMVEKRLCTTLFSRILEFMKLQKEEQKEISFLLDDSQVVINLRKNEQISRIPAIRNCDK